MGIETISHLMKPPNAFTGSPKGGNEDAQRQCESMHVQDEMETAPCRSTTSWEHAASYETS
jgi:hypothetical protein